MCKNAPRRGKIFFDEKYFFTAKAFLHSFPAKHLREKTSQKKNLAKSARYFFAKSFCGKISRGIWDPSQGILGENFSQILNRGKCVFLLFFFLVEMTLSLLIFSSPSLQNSRERCVKMIYFWSIFTLKIIFSLHVSSSEIHFSPRFFCPKSFCEKIPRRILRRKIILRNFFSQNVFSLQVRKNA